MTHERPEPAARERGAESDLERALRVQAPTARRAPSPGMADRVGAAIDACGSRAPFHRRPRPLALVAGLAASLLAAVWLWDRPAPDPVQPSGGSAPDPQAVAVAQQASPVEALGRPLVLPAFEAPLHREMDHLTEDAFRTALALRDALELPRRALARPR